MDITVDTIFDSLQERLKDDSLPLNICIWNTNSPQGSVALLSGKHVTVSVIDNAISLEQSTGDYISEKSTYPESVEEACNHIIHFIEHGELP